MQTIRRIVLPVAFLLKSDTKYGDLMVKEKKPSISSSHAELKLKYDWNVSLQAMESSNVKMTVDGRTREHCDVDIGLGR